MARVLVVSWQNVHGTKIVLAAWMQEVRWGSLFTEQVIWHGLVLAATIVLFVKVGFFVLQVFIVISLRGQVASLAWRGRRGLGLLLGLHPSVLEPDLDLPFGESELVSNLDASPPSEVPIKVELLLQLQGLVPCVGLSGSLWSTRNISCKKTISTCQDHAEAELAKTF